MEDRIHIGRRCRVTVHRAASRLIAFSPHGRANPRYDTGPGLGLHHDVSTYIVWGPEVDTSALRGLNRSTLLYECHQVLLWFMQARYDITYFFRLHSRIR